MNLLSSTWIHMQSLTCKKTRNAFVDDFLNRVISSVTRIHTTIGPYTDNNVILSTTQLFIQDMHQTD